MNVITIEQLDARLADEQAQIVARLEKALVVERRTQAEIQRLAIAARDIASLSTTGRNALAAAELGQRRVRWQLADAEEGVPGAAAALLAELKMNRVGSPDVQRAMQQLNVSLADLDAGPLSEVDTLLTKARKRPRPLRVPAQQVT